MLKEPILAPGLDGRAIIGGGVGGYGRRCHAVASLDLMVAIPRTVQTTLAFSWARFLVPWSVLWSQCTTTVMPGGSSLHSFVLSLSRTADCPMAAMASWGCSVGFSTFAPLKLLSSQLTWARNRDGSNRWRRIHGFRRQRKTKRRALDKLGVVVLCRSLISVHSLLCKHRLLRQTFAVAPFRETSLQPPAAVKSPSEVRVSLWDLCPVHLWLDEMGRQTPRSEKSSKF